MSQEQLESYLISALKKLEDMTDKILNTRGYTQETKKLRALQELIKEQLRNENTHHSTRPAR